MSKRQNVRKTMTPNLQGPGSFVEFKRFTYGESKAIREAAAAHADDENWQQEESLRVLAEHLIAWNWVDDDGNALPLPKDDPAVLDQLTDEEVKFLIGLFGDKTDAKN